MSPRSPEGLCHLLPASRNLKTNSSSLLFKFSTTGFQELRFPRKRTYHSEKSQRENPRAGSSLSPAQRDQGGRPWLKPQMLRASLCPGHSLSYGEAAGFS